MNTPFSPVVLMDAAYLNPFLSTFNDRFHLATIAEICAGNDAADKIITPLIDRLSKEATSADSLEPIVGEDSCYPFLTANGVATIAVHGALTPREAWWIEYLEGCSYERISLCAMVCAMDPAVTSVVLDFCSGGGDVSGMTECADAIKVLSLAKPTTAYISDTCCSAAYRLALSCREIVASSVLALTLSIGVLGGVADDSKSTSLEGSVYHKFATGDQKGVGAYFSPVTDEQLTRLKARCDSIGETFVSAVNDSRGSKLTEPLVLGAGYADGASYLAADALKAGFIDAILGRSAMLERMSQACAGSESPDDLPGTLPEGDSPITTLTADGKHKVTFFGTEKTAVSLSDTPKLGEQPLFPKLALPDFVEGHAVVNAVLPASITAKEPPMNIFNDAWDALTGKNANAQTEAANRDLSMTAVIAASGFVLAESVPADARLAAFQAFLSNQKTLAADGLAARIEAIDAACELANRAQGPGTVTDEAKSGLIAKADTILLADVKAKMGEYNAKAHTTFAPTPDLNATEIITGQVSRTAEQIATETAKSNTEAKNAVAGKTAEEVSRDYDSNFGSIHN